MYLAGLLPGPYSILPPARALEALHVSWVALSGASHLSSLAPKPQTAENPRVLEVAQDNLHPVIGPRSQREPTERFKELQTG